MDRLEFWLGRVHAHVWGMPLLVLLAGTGIYLTFLLRGLQFRYLFYAIKLLCGGQIAKGKGDISHFQSLMTALAATIGVGTIAGVATAIGIGGVGAIFWMVVIGMVGMATKYAEAVLAVKYRIVDEGGRMAGGPMYYLEKGLKAKPLAIAFAFFGALAALGTGNLIQAHSVIDACADLFDFNPWVAGVILSVCVGAVILGGIRTIGAVAGVLVPVMALLYICGGLIIFVKFWHSLPGAFMEIVRAAFHGQAAVGGFIGSTVLMAVQEGFSKGMFSNESGLGSAPIAAAAAKTDHPGRQAMVSMMGTFFTVVLTGMTGVVIAVTGVLGQVGPKGRLLGGAPLTIHAFATSFPGGGVVLTVGLVLFAFSTILGWGYYGERCCEYLLGYKSIFAYRILYTLVVIPGAVLSLNAVWSLTGIMNGLMAVPNLIGLLGLSPVVAAETRAFLGILKEERRK